MRLYFDPIDHRIEKIGDRKAGDKGEQNAAGQYHQRNCGGQNRRPNPELPLPAHSPGSIAAARRLQIIT